MKEARAYENAHSDLLAILMKRYLEKDFTWMEKLASAVSKMTAKRSMREKRERGMRLLKI